MIFTVPPSISPTSRSTCCAAPGLEVEEEAEAELILPCRGRLANGAVADVLKSRGTVRQRRLWREAIRTGGSGVTL